jgi:hypothetical protein
VLGRQRNFDLVAFALVLARHRAGRLARAGGGFGAAVKSTHGVSGEVRRGGRLDAGRFVRQQLFAFRRK